MVRTLCARGKQTNFSRQDYTHGCHGDTPVLQSWEEFVGVPVPVMDSGPHLDGDRAAGHCCHSSHYRLEPRPPIHQRTPCTLRHMTLT